MSRNLKSSGSAQEIGRSSIIILAAGFGKRMHSSLPKVLIPVCGKPMILHILDRISEASAQEGLVRVAMVVSHQKEKVMELIQKVQGEGGFKNLKIDFIDQGEPKGTGHAIQVAMVSAWGKTSVELKEEVLVLPGDLPLVTSSLIHEMLQPLSKGMSVRLLTALLPEPTGYGRIVRKGKKGPVIRIVEEKDANLREKMIQEVGLSIYSFKSSFLSSNLQKLKNKNAQGEYYLTDLIQIAAQLKKGIEVLPWNAIEDVRGINNPYELTLASGVFNQRVLKKLALQGVRFQGFSCTQVEATVSVAPDVTIGTGVVLEGNTQIEAGAVIGPHAILKNVVVKEGAEVKAGTYAEDSIIGKNSKVGPYAHLRPNSHVGEGAKIGNFVELKNTQIGKATSVAHLSYLGDAEVGERVNIGCGFVTCNFDGRVIEGQRKHKTVIGDDAFIGSDCQAVAPVQIGRGAYVASGSTVTENVESDALAIARSRQVNKPQYAKKLREQK